MESFDTLPLAGVIPSYLYDQFNDDADLQAFVDSYNAIAQGYLDWFNETPLGVYTSDAISGPLLDWMAQSLWGIQRPVISTSSTTTKGAVNTFAVNTMAVNGFKKTESGTAYVASDDLYKRVLTWYLFLGDGKQMSMHWIKHRIARFLYGSNGSNVSVDYLNYISIQPVMMRTVAGVNSRAVNTFAVNTFAQEQAKAVNLIIQVPQTTVTAAFIALLQQGILPMPTQITFTITENNALGPLLDTSGSAFTLNSSTLG
ncbi:MAG: hypothetical protein ACYC0Z_14920 [Acidobacteriaceae bacterium]